jgi:hypothetical protein
MKSLSLIFAVLFSFIQQSSEKKFYVSELGFSFEVPAWYGAKNENFSVMLKKHKGNVENTIKSVGTGSIDVVRYYKSATNKDVKVFLNCSLGGVHEKLRDFDKLIKFERAIKLNMPNLKILQPITATNISGKKAIVSYISYNESDKKGNSYKIFSKRLNIFMGNYTYNIYMQTKDVKDIEVFDRLIKTIAITR